MLSLVLLGNMAEARKVTGKVVCGKEKLSGVIVTDGKSFTKTVKGKFAFDIADDAEFVYIVTPAGYAADWSTGVPAFYQSAKDCKKFTFELLKTGTIISSALHSKKFANIPLIYHLFFLRAAVPSVLCMIRLCHKLSLIHASW